jgi:outer membrane receptor protein involved in Fe transport
MAQSTNEQTDSDTTSQKLNDVERIVVTADLSKRDLSELPGSNFVLSEALLESREARHLQDLVAAIPNVNFTSGSSRGKFIQIRGIGERSQFSEPVNPSIGLLLDDIDISGLGSLATIYDLQQVEILSGPQSVATGVNSLGGVIKLVSHAATETTSASFTASLAEHNAQQIGGAYGMSLGKGIAAKISGQINREDGNIYNAFLDTDDTNNIDETTATLFL